MFKEVSEDILERFRLIYHQTTEYTNPVIETVLYQNNGGRMFYWGDPIDGNYFIFHRSGFAHINLNPFDESLDTEFFKEVDRFLKSNSAIPDYLMFYHLPTALLAYWKTQEKKYFKIRMRRRYQIDNSHFMTLDPSSYAAPPDHQLLSLQQCPYKDLEVFDLSLGSKFYDSKEDFLQNSFGFVLYNEERTPVALSYLICFVGRNSECDLKTLPDFRNKGYGYITITNYVRESILRKINVGWDCFVDNYTDKWVKQYGYTRIIREYEFVTFLK